MVVSFSCGFQFMWFHVDSLVCMGAAVLGSAKRRVKMVYNIPIFQLWEAGCILVVVILGLW